jgi:hypothetical protein
VGSIVREAHQDTSAVTVGSYNLVVLTGPFKVQRIVVTGAISFPSEALVAGDFFLNPLLLGVQAIPNGNTPLTLPSAIGNSEFLVVEAYRPQNAFAAWAPSTDTAEAIGGGEFSLTWAGQAYYAGTTDFLFTTGLQNGSESLLVAVCMTIWYT